jgi:hypothetical protein
MNVLLLLLFSYGSDEIEGVARDVKIWRGTDDSVVGRGGVSEMDSQAH